MPETQKPFEYALKGCDLVVCRNCKFWERNPDNKQTGFCKLFDFSSKVKLEGDRQPLASLSDPAGLMTDAYFGCKEFKLNPVVSAFQFKADPGPILDVNLVGDFELVRRLRDEAAKAASVVPLNPEFTVRRLALSNLVTALDHQLSFLWAKKEGQV